MGTSRGSGGPGFGEELWVGLGARWVKGCGGARVEVREGPVVMKGLRSGDGPWSCVGHGLVVII